jgi:hypothetical protein
MATISITIPDNKVQWVIDAMCDWGDYEENRIDGNETEAEFAKRMIALKVKGITISYIRKTKHAEMNDDILAEQTGLNIT